MCIVLHEIDYFVFFGKKQKNSTKFTFFSSEIQVFRSVQFSLLMYRCLLPSSANVKMDYKENMENACYAANDDTPL